MTMVYAVPTWICFVIVVGGLSAFVVGMHAAIRACFRRYDFIRHNDVAGILVTVVASLYAVVLGFITIVVWQQYNDSDARNREEVGAVATAYQLARVLPPTLQLRLQGDLRKYVSEVADHEFGMMDSGESSTQATQMLLDAQGAIAGFNPRTTGLGVVQAALLTHIDTAIDRRRTRLEDNSEGIGPLLWTALLVGAFCVIGFSFLFGMENFRVQLSMTALIAVVIGTMFVVIMELDYPFRGDNGISPAVWVSALGRMDD